MTLQCYLFSILYTKYSLMAVYFTIKSKIGAHCKPLKEKYPWYQMPCFYHEFGVQPVQNQWAFPNVEVYVACTVTLPWLLRLILCCTEQDKRHRGLCASALWYVMMTPVLMKALEGSQRSSNSGQSSSAGARTLHMETVTKLSPWPTSGSWPNCWWPTKLLWSLTRWKRKVVL